MCDITGVNDLEKLRSNFLPTWWRCGGVPRRGGSGRPPKAGWGVGETSPIYKWYNGIIKEQ